MVWQFLKGDDMSTPDAKAHWEEHYGERDRVWSGRVNARLVEVAAPLHTGPRPRSGLRRGRGRTVAGRARLARRRGRHLGDGAEARAAGCRGARRRRPHRLPAARPVRDASRRAPFDLVTAQFLHSTLPLDRTRIFTRAADAIRPGGLLLIVDHGGAAAVGVEAASPPRVPQRRRGRQGVESS